MTKERNQCCKVHFTAGRCALRDNDMMKVRKGKKSEGVLKDFCCSIFVAATTKSPRSSLLSSKSRS